MKLETATGDPPPDGHKDLEFLRTNSGPGKLCPKGPVCAIDGQECPTHVDSCPNASVTSAILAYLLRWIDDHKMVSRGRECPAPFPPLDGNGSRFEFPFSNHIGDPNNKGHCDKWTCCTGVPCGTHLWQVGDALELKGSCKIFL